MAGESTSTAALRSNEWFHSGETTRASAVPCYHCGSECPPEPISNHEKAFCCQGCLSVFQILTENGLGNYYSLNPMAGVRVQSPLAVSKFTYLDDPGVREGLVDFSDEFSTRVTFRIPAIHCIACVWLLENLFRLKPGIGRSQVNYPRKEVALIFENNKIKLSEIAALLASLGYEPELKFADIEKSPSHPSFKTLWLRLGVAGFAFGNTMLFSIANYLGLDSFSGPTFKTLVGYLSLALGIPVVLYSAGDYWRLAWQGLKQRMLTIEVPIAAGIIAIFAQSAYEVLSGNGEGYFDSLAGLLFFLLCGKLFQQKTFDRLAFDRDYKSFFPLLVTRLADGAEQSLPLSQLKTGDHLLVRNGELIPADCRHLCGPCIIDYSFVTGESDPVEKNPGDYLYAGGRQVGGAIEIETVKPVSQSYLTSLWNQVAFRKTGAESLDSLTNRFSQRFTKIVIGISLGAALFWAFFDPSRSLKAFTSVLIVACPCALALAAPFTLGTALRMLGRRQVYVKSPQVIETLARVNAVVFDKTGTLTAAGEGSVTFSGVPLSQAEESWFFSLMRHSTHPYSVRISEHISRNLPPEPVRSFLEIPGCGIEANVAGHELWAGSAPWLASKNVALPNMKPSPGSVVHCAMDGRYRGCFTLTAALRPHTPNLVRDLSKQYDLALLTGDNEKEQSRFEHLFGRSAPLHFNQSPLEKLQFVTSMQNEGKIVMMVGDGLNDAGALKQSDVGVAVVEKVSAFSPASDIILSSTMVPRTAALLRYSKGTVRIVRMSFAISSLYNVVGISIAASGLLAPIVCAILMPLSSVTVVAFACGAAAWYARKAGLGPSNPFQT